MTLFLKTSESRGKNIPLQKDIAKYSTVINSDDAPILASAVTSGADFLVTWDKKHFISKKIRVHSSLKIVTPGEFLKHFRKYIEGGGKRFDKITG